MQHSNRGLNGMGLTIVFSPLSSGGSLGREVTPPDSAGHQSAYLLEKEMTPSAQ